MGVSYIKATHREQGTWSWREILPSWLLKQLIKDGWVILEVKYSKNETD